MQKPLYRYTTVAGLSRGLMGGIVASDYPVPKDQARRPLRAPVAGNNHTTPAARRSAKDDISVLLLNEKAVKRSISGKVETVIKWDTALYVGGFEIFRTAKQRWELLPSGRIQLPEVYERDRTSGDLNRSNLLYPTQVLLEAVHRAISTYWLERGNPSHPLYDAERPWPYPLHVLPPDMRAHRWDDLELEMPNAAKALITQEHLAKAQLRFRETDANKRREELIRRLTLELKDAEDPVERTVIEDAIARLRAEIGE